MLMDISAVCRSSCGSGPDFALQSQTSRHRAALASLTTIARLQVEGGFGRTAAAPDPAGSIDFQQKG
jgi:hypothetical protein